MRRMIAALLVVGGCSFSGIGGGDGDGDGDVPDGGGDVPDGGGGLTDARPAATAGPEVRTTDANGDSKEPAVVWTGSEFGVVWSDNRGGEDEIYFARVGVDGAVIGSEMAVTATSMKSARAALTWTGSEFGIVWEDERNGNQEIYFTSLDAAGATVVDDLRITNNAGASKEPSLAWTGTNFAVVWSDDRDGNEEIYFCGLNAAGTKIGSDQRLTNSMGKSERVSLTWTGVELGVAWNDDRDGDKDIYFARLDTAGVQQGVDTVVTSTVTNSEEPSLVWTGASFGLAWHDERDGNKEIYVAVLDAAGAVVGAEVRVTNSSAGSERPSLSWLGSEFGLVWNEKGASDEVQYLGLDAAGGAIGQALQTTTSAGDSRDPVLAGVGSVLLTSWSDNRDGNDEIYVQTLAP